MYISETICKNKEIKRKSTPEPTPHPPPPLSLIFRVVPRKEFRGHTLPENPKSLWDLRFTCFLPFYQLIS